MASLAGLLKAKGYRVTGTDTATYTPMSTQLELLGIKPSIGYDPVNLDPRPDLVIIGNVIRRDNLEARATIEKQIPYLSMPQALSELFLKDKESIVVTGTHGKTTTSNIIAWLLEYAGTKPSFLIGGVGINFGESYKLAGGKYFVTEGDEYDTAFFDKGPKFLHYRPKYATITSIEFDHADIYKDLAQIKRSFTRFIEIIPTDGLCIINADSNEIPDILKGAHCKIATYGFSAHADYRISSQDRAGTKFTIFHAGKESDFTMALAGRHNGSNAVAALALLTELGVDDHILSKGMALFKGVKRRQEVRGVVNSVTVIDDFAHHPTAIRETIDAIRARYAHGRLWAIFEPRSNTSRRNIFEAELASSFKNADKTIIADVFHATDIPEAERLKPETVVEAINNHGGSAYFIPGTDNIVEFVVNNAVQGDTILVMSNGAFDNIHEKLITGIGKK